MAENSNKSRAHDSNIKAYFAFTLLGLIWGSNFIFMKWGAAIISPAQITLLRVLFGFLPLLVFALATRSLRWSDLRHSQHFIVMAILATSIYYFAFAHGTALLPSSLAGMLSGAIPLFTFVTAFIFLREEPINTRSVCGIIVGFIGILLIAKPWNTSVGMVNLEGTLSMIAGSLSVGVSFVYARKFLRPLALKPIALATYQIGFALLILAVAVDSDGISAITNDPRALAGLIAGLGLLGTGLAYILYYFIVDNLGAIKASGVTYIPPVVALIIGALLNEAIYLIDLIAIVAILLGVALLQSSRSHGDRQQSL